MPPATATASMPRSRNLAAQSPPISKPQAQYTTALAPLGSDAATLSTWSGGARRAPRRRTGTDRGVGGQAGVDDEEARDRSRSAVAPPGCRRCAARRCGVVPAKRSAMRSQAMLAMKASTWRVGVGAEIDVDRSARTCRAPAPACRPRGCGCGRPPRRCRASPSRGEPSVSTHPARAAAQCLAHGDELGAPAGRPSRNRARSPRPGRRPRSRGSPPPPSPIALEVDLVQQHRVGGDQLLALQPVQAKAGTAAGSSAASSPRMAFRRRTAPP